MRPNQRQICVGIASFILIVLALIFIYTNPSDELFKVFLNATQQSLFGASLGIIGVFAINAELPKKYQGVKIIFAGLMVLFILMSLVRFVIHWSPIFEVYSSLYFFAFSYLWGMNKIKQGSYEKLREYKKVALYPAIIYCFIINQVFAVILHTF